MGYFTDNSSKDLTEQVAWKSSDKAIATIETGSVQTVSVGEVAITASLNGVTSNTATITVTDAKVASLQITPAIAQLPKGLTQSLTALAHFTDRTTQDVSTLVAWHSTETATLTVTPTGIAQAIEVGDAIVKASLMGISSNEANLTVTDAEVVSVQITPAVSTVIKGLTQPFTAIAHFTDNTSKNVDYTATWLSSDSTVVTLATTDPSPQIIAQAVEVGKATITAVYGGITSNVATITVEAPFITELEITTDSTKLPKGASKPLQARAYYSNNTTVDVSYDAAWRSQDTSTLTESNTGTAVAVGIGDAEVFASLDGVVSNALIISAVPAVLTRIEVTPSEFTLAKGLTKQLSAQGFYSDGTSADITNEVDWRVEFIYGSLDTFATVTKSGLVQGVNVGDIRIFASITTTNGNYLSDSAQMTITPAEITKIQVTAPQSVMYEADTQDLLATAWFTDNTSSNISEQATWLSSDTSVLTVVEGKVTSVAEGEAFITASLEGVSSLPVTLTVLPLCNEIKWASIRIEATHHNPNELSLCQDYEGADYCLVNTSSFVGGSRNATISFKAIGIMDSGIERDITADVEWHATNLYPSSTTIGKFTAYSSKGDEPNGSIYVSQNGVQSNVLKVGHRYIESFKTLFYHDGIEFSGIELEIGKTYEATHLVYRYNHDPIDVTPYVRWHSGNKNVFTVEFDADRHPTKALIIPHAPGHANVTISFVGYSVGYTRQVK